MMEGLLKQQRNIKDARPVQQQRGCHLMCNQRSFEYFIVTNNFSDNNYWLILTMQQCYTINKFLLHSNLHNENAH